MRSTYSCEFFSILPPMAVYNALSDQDGRVFDQPVDGFVPRSTVLESLSVVALDQDEVPLSVRNTSPPNVYYYRCVMVINMVDCLGNAHLERDPITNRLVQARKFVDFGRLQQALHKQLMSLDDG